MASKSHFLDTLKSDILIDNNNEPCECCGIYHSVGMVTVTDERNNDNCAIQLCAECILDIKRKKDGNLLNIYSVSQVLK